MKFGLQIILVRIATIISNCGAVGKKITCPTLHRLCGQKVRMDMSLKIATHVQIIKGQFLEKEKKTYISTLTGAVPVPHPRGVAGPPPPSKETLSSITGTSGNVDYDNEFLDPSYVDESEEDEPDFMTQKNMDFFVAKTGMSQRMAEWSSS